MDKHNFIKTPIGVRGKKPSEMVQLDHMTVNFTEGTAIKEFKMACPSTSVATMRACRVPRLLQALSPHDGIGLETPMAYYQ
ncbi:MAG: hypothetical protein ACR2P9_08915 [Gammaproteobacteria bacterium]